MRRMLVLFALLGAVSAASAQISPLLPGDHAPDFTLPDYNREMVTLSDFSDSAATVVVFISTRCPVSKDYDTRMRRLAVEFQERGVAFVGVNSNKQEWYDEVREHARQQRFPFPVVKDSANVIADEFGATRTPEVYVLSKGLVVLYHGRIDDNQREMRVESHDLRDALDAILSGQPAPNANTSAFGCTIKRVDS